MVHSSRRSGYGTCPETGLEWEVEMGLEWELEMGLEWDWNGSLQWDVFLNRWCVFQGVVYFRRGLKA